MKDYEAEMDANTIAEAAAIKANRPRFSKARKAAARLATEQQTKATALKKVAKRPPARKAARRSTKRK